MPSKNTKFYSLILIALDLIVLSLVFFVAYYVRTQLDSRDLVYPVYMWDYVFGFAIIAPIWILIYFALGLYNANIYNRRLIEWGRIILGTMLGVLLVIGWEYVTRIYIFPARLVTLYVLIGAIVSIIASREIVKAIRTQLYRYGYGISRVLVIGTSLATKDISMELAATHKSGFQIVAFAGPSYLMPTHLGVHHYKNVEDALADIKERRITTIIQTDLYDSEERNQKILGAAQLNHIQYNFIPGEAEFYTGKNTVDVFLGYPMITVSQTPLIGWGAILKRFFDIFAVIISSPFWVPLFGLIALAQKIFNPGPIFFMSTRLGLHGEKIETYKFRSMIWKYCGADAAKIFRDMGREDLAAEYEMTRKIEDDPRITKFGKFLRATSLDEVAQILNVLKGDMSLVGPRPIIKEEKKFYSDRAPLLFSVRPGVTGLWQVSGRSDLSFNQRVELELYYAQNWSFWLDIKILFKTIAVVIRRSGAK